MPRTLIVVIAGLVVLTFAYCHPSAHSDGVSLEELLTHMEATNADIALVDVRETGAYVRGHIPGALSFPLSQLVNAEKELPWEKVLIVYCD